MEASLFVGVFRRGDRRWLQSPLYWRACQPPRSRLLPRLTRLIHMNNGN